MKVIIAGGRDYGHFFLPDESRDQVRNNAAARTLFDAADAVIGTRYAVEVVSGCARGADEMGECYAAERMFTVRQFPADWAAHGRSAGPRRNKDMAEYADALIAFWDGKSRGTKHMIDVGLKQGLEVHVYRY